MPYLNARLEETNYNHKAKTLLWNNRDEGITYAFRPNEISIAPIADRETAVEICDNLIGMICDVWSKRNEIEPDFTGKAPPPNIVEMIKLLPGTNCKDCGYATCMAFAAGLIKKETELSQCSYLLKEDFTDNYSQLQELLD
jgi:ArsR family metal-binding transcriptional regulator